MRILILLTLLLPVASCSSNRPAYAPADDLILAGVNLAIDGDHYTINDPITVVVENFSRHTVLFSFQCTSSLEGRWEAGWGTVDLWDRGLASVMDRFQIALRMQVPDRGYATLYSDEFSIAPLP